MVDKIVVSILLFAAMLYGGATRLPYRPDRLGWSSLVLGVFAVAALLSIIGQLKERHEGRSGVGLILVFLTGAALITVFFQGWLLGFAGIVVMAFWVALVGHVFSL